VRERLARGLGAWLQVLCLCTAIPAHAADEDAPVIQSNVEVTAPSNSQPGPEPGFFTRMFTPSPLRQVVVADPYMEMHSGPGVGYPVVHVAGRGETVSVVKRRTDWYYVRTDRQIEGWVEREQMLATLELNGEPVKIKEPLRSDYTTRQFEGGAFFGRFGGASLLSVYGGYGLSDHLTVELAASKALGNLSDASLASIGLAHVFAPEWIVSPYFGLGTGVIVLQPHATLVKPLDSTDQYGYIAAGARGYLARRFLWRAEYRGNLVFTSRNKNEQIHEWKLGFAFFF
jgi:Bacterial SH3 domain